MSLDSIRTLNNQMEALLQKGDVTNTSLPATIKKLKLLIYTNPNISRESSEFIQQANRFAENNVLYSLKANLKDEFHRAIKKLDFFYENFAQLQKSKNYYELNALLLIDLLSLSQTQDFYAQLETFQGQSLNNKYIQYVVELNQAIEDGNYRYVFELRKSSPSPLFKPFLEKIQLTVRNEIARSSQASYNSLSFAQAIEIFQLQSDSQLKEFCQKVASSNHNTQIKWNVDTELRRIVFFNSSNKKPSINSTDLLRKALRYANEIERIV